MSLLGDGRRSEGSPNATNDEENGSGSRKDINLGNYRDMNSPLSRGVSTRTFSRIVGFTRLSNFATSRSTRECRQVFSKKGDDVLRSLRGAIRTLIRSFDDNFARGSLALTRCFKGQGLFFLTRDGGFLNVFRVRGARPPFPCV